MFFIPYQVVPSQPTWQWNGPLQKVSGWQCPGCGKCYAPIVRECDTCGKGAQKEGE